MLPTPKYCPGILKGVVITLVLLLLLSVPGTSFSIGEEKSEELLLREVEKLIEDYYLFPSIIEHFPLSSLKDLPEIFEDPHSEYLTREEFESFEEGFLQPFSGIGIQLGAESSRFKVVSTVPGSPAEKAGIKSGDVLVAVDGKFLSGVSLEETLSLIRGEPGTRVEVKVHRNGELKQFSIRREMLQLPAVEHAWKNEEIAILKVKRFSPGATEELKNTIEELKEEGLKGLIIDLRGNQGGYVDEALDATELFVDGPLLQFMGRDGGLEEIISKGEKLTLSTVLLLNSETASAAELFAAALKDNGAGILVGGVSFGKGTMQAMFDLEHGGYLKLTTAEFKSPLGRAIEAQGVEPHFLELDKAAQERLAFDILEHRLREGKGMSFLQLLLEELYRIDGTTPLPLEEEGETYYPLRALLFLTGRPINRSADTGNYFFFWEGRLFELFLKERKLVFTDPGGHRHERDVKIIEGRTYVHESFLLEDLKFSFL